MDPQESFPFAGSASVPYVVQEVELELVDPPEAQLRIDLDPDRLEELARSIGREGLINFPTLRKVGDRYKIRAGHRRVEAVRLLGWPRIPARIQSEGEGSSVAFAAHENLFREDLSPVEEAGAVVVLLEECGGDVDLCARRINRTRSWVDGRLRILSWPADIQEAVHRGELKAAQGAELAPITNDAHRRFLLEHAKNGGATSRTCAAWRIAWEQTGLVSSATVQQVAPGRTPPAPVEAELPCYFTGRRLPYSQLTHIWLSSEGLEAFTWFRDSYYGGGKDGAGSGVEPAPGRRGELL